MSTPMLENLLLVLHLLVAIGLVVIVLLQRSEGGALGMGGGGGGLVSGRGAANMLTQLTAILAAFFMMISLALAILANNRSAPQSIIDQMPDNSLLPSHSAPAEPITSAPSVPLSD